MDAGRADEVAVALAPRDESRDCRSILLVIAREHSQDRELEYSVRAVAEIRRSLHDSLLDESWPACPRHPAHALTYRDGAWWCDRDAVPIAALGDLPKSTP